MLCLLGNALLFLFVATSHRLAGAGDKQGFCKNEIKDYQLLTSLYFKIEVFAIEDKEYTNPLYVFEDFGAEKNLRTHIIH